MSFGSSSLCLTQPFLCFKSRTAALTSSSKIPWYKFEFIFHCHVSWRPDHDTPSCTFHSLDEVSVLVWGAFYSYKRNVLDICQSSNFVSFICKTYLKTWITHFISRRDFCMAMHFPIFEEVLLWTDKFQGLLQYIWYLKSCVTFSFKCVPQAAHFSYLCLAWKDRFVFRNTTIMKAMF